MHELEVQITDELALAESSRPEDPVVESDAGRRPNPTDVKAYETRLLTRARSSRSCGGRRNGSGRSNGRVGDSGQPRVPQKRGNRRPPDALGIYSHRPIVTA